MWCWAGGFSTTPLIWAGPCLECESLFSATQVMLALLFPMMLSAPCSWYALWGHQLIWKKREHLVKLWHDLRSRGGR